MDGKMKITLLQQDIAWGEAERNRQKAHELILRAPQSDLYVLPEMWNTGFICNPSECEELIEDAQGRSVRWMQEMANSTGAAIAGSIATRAKDGTMRTRLYFVRPGDTTPSYYDKHHLFTYANEDKFYTAGQENVTVEWQDVRFRLFVCYDLRFPIWCRNTSGASTYDVALYVASWPATRALAWRSLLIARAIENQCYVCGVNRIGSDPQCDYSGGSMMIDPYGNVMEACPDNQEGTITATLNLDKLRHFREKFPVLMDQDVSEVVK